MFGDAYTTKRQVACHVCGKLVERVSSKTAICFECKKITKGAYQNLYEARLHALHKKFRPDLTFEEWKRRRTEARKHLTEATD